MARSAATVQKAITSYPRRVDEGLPLLPHERDSAAVMEREMGQEEAFSTIKA